MTRKCKYFINGVSLWSYLKDHGYSKNKASNIYIRMKMKCMTPEEAIAYKRPGADLDQLTRVRRNHRRYSGYSDEQLNMSIEEAKRFGIMKRTKYVVGDKTLREYCKEKGIAYQTMINRILYQNMSVRQAINEPIVKPRKFYYKGQPVNKCFDRHTCHRIYDRVSHDWDIASACECPIDSFHNRKEPEKCVKSKVWASLGYGKSGVRFINTNKEEYISNKV